MPQNDPVADGVMILWKEEDANLGTQHVATVAAILINCPDTGNIYMSYRQKSFENQKGLDNAEADYILDAYTSSKYTVKASATKTYNLTKYVELSTEWKFVENGNAHYVVTELTQQNSDEPSSQAPTYKVEESNFHSWCKVVSLRNDDGTPNVNLGAKTKSPISP